MAKFVSREEFDKAVEAVWSEIEYQNNLKRRTDDEAQDIPGFLTLGRRYERLAEEHWADQEGTPQVEDALNDMRKITAIYLRSMIYCGIRYR